jgi:WD40 repeat protein
MPNQYGSRLPAIAAVVLVAAGAGFGDSAPSVFRGHEGKVCAMFSPNGKTLVTAAEDGVVKAWDIATGQSNYTISAGDGGINDVAYLPDGTLFATAGRDQNTRLWDARGGGLKRTLEGHRHEVTCLALDPSNKAIATGSLDHNVILWNVQTGERLRWFSGHSKGVLTVAYSPDGRLVASGGGDGVGKSGELFVWDTYTGKPKWNLKGKSETQVASVSFAPDGKSLAAGGVSGLVRIFATESGRELQSLDANDELRGLAYSPDGKMLALAVGKQIQLWELATGMVTRVLTGSDEWVGTVCFSSDGRRVVAGCSDGAARLWELTRVGDLRQRAQARSGR